MNMSRSGGRISVSGQNHCQYSVFKCKSSFVYGEPEVWKNKYLIAYARYRTRMTFTQTDVFDGWIPRIVIVLKTQNNAADLHCDSVSLRRSA